MADKGGRPPKFKTKQELEERINAYFESCFAPAVTKDGITIIDERTGKPMIQQVKPFTVAGLACFLDVDRGTLINYSKNDKFFNTIKKAKAKIEAYAEEQLFLNRSAAGVIFNLKNNFGWKDKNEVKVENAEDTVAEKLTEIFGFKQNAK